MVQGTGLHVLVERAISLNRPLRTRTVGGVGAGERNPGYPIGRLLTVRHPLLEYRVVLDLANLGVLACADQIAVSNMSHSANLRPLLRRENALVVGRLG